MNGHGGVHLGNSPPGKPVVLLLQQALELVRELSVAQFAGPVAVRPDLAGLSVAQLAVGS